MDTVQSFVIDKIITLQQDQQRGLLICVGTPQWHQQCVKALLSLLNTQSVLSFGFEQHSDVRNYRHCLGQEYQYLLFNGATLDVDRESFHVDAFTALSGTLRSGALAVLCLSTEQCQSSLFIQRMLAKAATYDNIDVRYQQSLSIDAPSLANTLPAQCEVPLSLSAQNVQRDSQVKAGMAVCKTREQAIAVDAIIDVLSGHRHRPLIVTADRGRGKSSALAIATVRMALQGAKRIVITAPHPDSLNIYYQQVLSQLPHSTSKANVISVDDSTIEFIPLDVLLTDKVNASIVLVDEAAGFPVAMLVKLLHRYSRLVFSSTIHGYEGAGRGFSQKFMAIVQQQAPNHRHLHIKQPIRWQSNDALEHYCFESFLLAAQLPNVSSNRGAVDIRFHQAKTLQENEQLLTQVFSLLVGAHYQTKPSDLKLLLDDEHVHIAIAQCDDVVCGVCLLLIEGDLEPSLVKQIKLAKRRPKGHLLPQSLLVHSGFDQAFDYRYLRVARVAVIPQWQQQGIGSLLLAQCQQYGQTHDVDFLCSSFGVNSALLDFWQANDFAMLRLGFSKDKASGEHSAMMAKPLSARAEHVQRQLNQQFYVDFDYYLADQFTQLDSQLVWQILAMNTAGFSFIQSAQRDAQLSAKFVNKTMQYVACAASLQRWFLTHINRFSDDKELQLSADQRAILIKLLLQRQSHTVIAQSLSLTGKKAVGALFYKAFSQMFSRFSNDCSKTQ